MTKEKVLRDMLVDEIRDMYDAERQLTKALPKLIRASSDEDLRSALESHLDETRGHVERLEEVFGLFDEKVKGKHCAGMAGIIEEGADILEELDKGALLDACLVAAGQRAEHYEMAAYGTAIAWAQILGEGEAASLLELTLNEEKAADRKLSEIAEQGVNQNALGDDDNEDSEGRAPVAVAAGRKSPPPARGAGRR